MKRFALKKWIAGGNVPLSCWPISISFVFHVISVWFTFCSSVFKTIEPPIRCLRSLSINSFLNFMYSSLLILIPFAMHIGNKYKIKMRQNNESCRLSISCFLVTPRLRYAVSPPTFFYRRDQTQVDRLILSIASREFIH